MRPYPPDTSIIEPGEILDCGCEVNILWVVHNIPKASRGVWMCDKHRKECANLSTLAEKEKYVDEMMEVHAA